MSLVVPAARAPEVSVLMVLHGGGRLAVRAIEAVVEHTPVPFEVIVVDNASPDDSLDVVASIRGLTVLDAGTNLGFGPANNLAASVARSPRLCMLNADTRVLPGWYAPLAQRLGRPGTGAVAPILVDEQGDPSEAGGVVDHWGRTAPFGRVDFDGPCLVPPTPVLVDYASAACLMMRAADFARVGGFDGAFRFAYYEDVDLCFRLWAKGAEVWCEPASRVVHLRGGTSDPARAIELWHMNRSVFLSRWLTDLRDRPAFEDRSAASILATWRARRCCHIDGGRTTSPADRLVRRLMSFRR